MLLYTTRADHSNFFTNYNSHTSKIKQKIVSTSKNSSHTRALQTISKFPPSNPLHREHEIYRETTFHIQFIHSTFPHTPLTNTITHWNPLSAFGTTNKNPAHIPKIMSSSIFVKQNTITAISKKILNSTLLPHL